MSNTGRQAWDGSSKICARKIEALLAEIAPSGRLTEVVRSSALIARRP
jgi:hypothetical protein